jgi:hypothetical protein
MALEAEPELQGTFCFTPASPRAVRLSSDVALDSWELLIICAHFFDRFRCHCARLVCSDSEHTREPKCNGGGVVSLSSTLHFYRGRAAVSLCFLFLSLVL